MKLEAPQMRVAIAILSAAFTSTAFRVSAAQAPQGAVRPAGAADQISVSAQLQPALGSVHRSVDQIRIDKWKRGNIRDEAARNISQIQRDIDVTLPPMLRDADTAPMALSTLLPISRNISALYDVLLRVVEASRVVAPDEQVGQLQQALVALGNARLAFGDRMQTAAVAMEKQVADLRSTVQTQADKIAAAPTPVAVPCTPAPKTTPKKTTRKPAAAKTTGAKPAATPQPSGTSQPSGTPQQNNPQPSSH